MATALFVVLRSVALLGWWILLVGTNAGLELVAGGCAAFLAALLAAGLRRQGLLRYRFEPRWLVKALKVPWRVVYELGVVVWALALHLLAVRRIGSRYRALPFPAGGDDATSRGRRAVAALADAVSPNTMPIDVDAARNVALRHELDPRRASSSMP